QGDANHNVTSVVGDSANVVLRIAYAPYGSVILLHDDWTLLLDGGTPVTAGNDSYQWIVLFQGGEYDRDSGLYTYQRRQYDPELGRWIEPDPARVGTNWYEFLTDGPTAGTDPTGLDRYII